MLMKFCSRSVPHIGLPTGVQEIISCSWNYSEKARFRAGYSRIRYVKQTCSGVHGEELPGENVLEELVHPFFVIYVSQEHEVMMNLSNQ